jgi:subtilisin family serine protease
LYAEPNRIRKAVAVPNDSEYSVQWGLQTINALDAWDKLDLTKMSETIVAVIDTGLDMNHEDLKNRVIPGYDFYDKDSDPSPVSTDETHATHVSGIIVAETNNSIGVAGTVGEAPIKIMPLRVLNNDRGDDYTIAEAIKYAADNGAKVINMSLAGVGPSITLGEAIAYAISKNVVVVCAAGNSSEDVMNYVPASIPGVVCVSATEKDIYSYKPKLKLASYSNYGNRIDITAPGTNIYSSMPRNRYGYLTGTSMACPMVAAVAATIMSKNPTLTESQVKHIIFDTATDIGYTGKDLKFGYGLVNFSKALENVEYPENPNQ